MQNKGLIRLFAILFGLVSLYSLSFTFFANKVEKEALTYATANAKENDGREIAKLEKKYLDSVANIPGVLGFGDFTYNDIKDKEINLGLDLKGGINATLQVSVKDILIGLSNDSKNPIFNQALEAATAAQKNSSSSYFELFYQEFEKIAGDTKLSDPSIFGTKNLREKITFNTTNAEAKDILAGEIDASISTAFQVLRSRIDKFGVTQPNIQRIGTSGRILIELPGAKDVERVKKLLQSTAELQFWEVYTGQELVQFLVAANQKVSEIIAAETPKEKSEVKKDASADDSIDALLGEAKTENDSISANNKTSLFSFLQPTGQASSVIGYAAVKDTAKVNEYLNNKQVRALLTGEYKYAKFLWDAKATNDVLPLYAIKSNRTDKAPIEGDVISDASQQFDQLGSHPEVSMTMNGNGSKLWAKMTAENKGKFVAVVLDNYVYTAPRVNDAITGGRTSISGNFTIEEATDLANVLKAGKLPAAAHIIQSEVVGPSLGQEAINASLISFALAIVLVLGWMILYYGKAGWFADVALLVNILFIFGILTSFGAVLTLPGIAGIILTIGMSVDANVIIFESIKENLRSGKGITAAIDGGFSIKGALSAIIDANITTLLTGGILYVFGTGPIQGFAFTLIVGILTSLFTAIFITRLLLDAATTKGKTLAFSTPTTKKWFTGIEIEFLQKRKKAYILSAIIILIGLGSLFTNGLNYGVDFVGGRTYTVRFDETVKSNEVAASLKEVFGSAPEVKTYGNNNQLKITTKYLIDEEGAATDTKVETALYNGLKPYLPEGTSMEDFKGGFTGQTIGILSYAKVEPTIADDIKEAAGWAIIGSLLGVFLYILLRFKKWEYSLGAVAAVFHDVLVVLSVFSITYKLMPFDMEIDQAFIAAILTVVGYSLNDTVVIFDKIREFTETHTKWSMNDVVNKGLSSTLGRTINTSITTLVVLIAIFLFGGDSIKGFMFALIIGVVVGTYSSLFIASPIMYDAVNKKSSKK
ncbi:preprotein translocase subunit SecD [Wenyingzhuangia fucanilytica]|uniref:Multifunctional fusion protein n=1 Tax=Wenyingzhuangia fucanilytica TaxID=1790137 RepID=A0A1B1Y8K8_9FLAO|nr:protein translocase subunit SecDF [Wenyingzhuangia fucanilytica]ANW97120.1 preprotein translocase subunit SecD [Wenyingzhuangia fucanilytica]